MVEVVGEPVVKKLGSVRPQNMSVVVDPAFALYQECGILARRPLCAVFAQKNKRFIEEEAFNMIEDSCCAIVRILARHPVAFGDWLALMVEHVAKVAKVLYLPPAFRSSALIFSSTFAFPASIVAFGD